MPTLATAMLSLWLCPAARADFVPCEQQGTIALDLDGQHVWASFLGACGEAADYDEDLAVQVDLDDGWSIVGDRWSVQGTEEIEVDGEQVLYRVLAKQVPCPGRGPYDFRLAWINRDGIEVWFSERIDCKGSLGCTATRPATAPLLGLLALCGGLPLLWRRRRP